ncbi:MAG: hypothetical protein M3362_07315 [Acidobacteriota bacterium]|nr:hypothetical protein [Acidobacteriota bacterium]
MPGAIISHYRLCLCFLLFAFLLSACSRSWNPECGLSTGNAPEVRGVRLGMTLEEFKERFPSPNVPFAPADSTQFRSDEDGVIAVAGTDVSTSEEDRAHVGQLLFVDGRVAHFRIVYDNYTDRLVWDNVDQFVSKTARSLKLPTVWVSENSLAQGIAPELWEAEYKLLWSTIGHRSANWHPADNNSANRFLLCGDTLVSAGLASPGKTAWTNGAFIQFDDLQALRQLRSRMSQRQALERGKEGGQRDVFNP